ncbi:MAG: DUF4159 domain-containing protein [Myxococcota bacterium]|nr:DUF4159 domain-containing protein [Myxococcota bacterium]
MHGELLSIGLFEPTLSSLPAGLSREEGRRPGAVQQLLWELSKRTSVRVNERPTILSPALPNWVEKLYTLPLLVWLGEGTVEPFTEETSRHLNQWLRAGGVLFIDDISPLGDDRFDRSVRPQLRRIWPEGTLTRVEADHTIYRSFYLLDKPYGRISRRRWLEEISFEELSPILYAREDTFGALGRDYLGQWRLPVSPGGAVQREYAFRFAINLLMYSTCLNYKSDQVHTLTILRRRRVAAPPR